jgi:DNA-binding SARP family transcriptional activator
MSIPLMRTSVEATWTNDETLCLLGGPYVVSGGRRLTVPEGSKRLLAFVALHGGRVDRRHAAGTLWPYGDDERAAGNLRSALWRLKGAGINLLRADKCALYLTRDTTIDVQLLSDWAGRIIDGTATRSDVRLIQLSHEAIDLLPGWYDDWVIFERERMRQRLLHALETLSWLLVRSDRCAEAVEVAMTAVSVEPLRESAQASLIKAHLAEGNLVEARRALAAYDEIVRTELGIRPSNSLVSLVHPERQDSARRGAPARSIAVAPTPSVTHQGA